MQSHFFGEPLLLSFLFYALMLAAFFYLLRVYMDKPQEESDGLRIVLVVTIHGAQLRLLV